MGLVVVDCLARSLARSRKRSARSLSRRYLANSCRDSLRCPFPSTSSLASLAEETSGLTNGRLLDSISEAVFAFWRPRNSFFARFSRFAAFFWRSAADVCGVDPVVNARSSLCFCLLTFFFRFFRWFLVSDGVDVSSDGVPVRRRKTSSSEKTTDSLAVNVGKTLVMVVVSRGRRGAGAAVELAVDSTEKEVISWWLW